MANFDPFSNIERKISSAFARFNNIPGITKGMSSVASDYVKQVKEIRSYINEQNKSKAVLQQTIELNKKHLENIQKVVRANRQMYNELSRDIRVNRAELIEFQKRTAGLKNLNLMQGIVGNSKEEFDAIEKNIGRVLDMMLHFDKEGSNIPKSWKSAAQDELFALTEMQSQLKKIIEMEAARNKLGYSMLLATEKEAKLRSRIVDLMGATKKFDEQIEAARGDETKLADLYKHQQNIANMNRTLFSLVGGPQAMKYVQMIQTIVSGFTSLSTIGGALRGILPFVLTIAVKLLSIFIDTGKQVTKSFIDAGYSAGQFKVALTGIKDAMIDMRQRGLVGFDTDFAKWYAEIKPILGAVMGDINPSNALVNNVIEMNKVFKVSAENAAQLVTTLDTISKGDDKFGTRANTWIKKVAGTLGVTYKDLAESMSKNSELMYRYGQRGFDMLVRQAGILKTMRVDMQAMTGFADSIVNDFSGWLDKQATLQTAFPGFNLDEVMYESFFGTEAGIAKALKGAMNEQGITSISQMPRMLQNILSSQLGLGFSDLEGILAGRGREESFENIEKFNAASVTKQTAILDSLGTDGLIVFFLKQIYGVLAPLQYLNPFTAGRKLLGMDSPPIPDRYDITSGMALNHGAMHSPKKFHTGGIISSLTKKLLPNEIPAILQKGETVLTGMQLKGLGSLMEGVKAISNIGSQFKTMLGDKIGSITKSISSILGKDGIVGSITKAFSGGPGGILGGTRGILGSIGGILGGGAGGILGKVGGILGGGSGGLLGMLGGKLGIGGLAGGPLGMAASLAMPLLSKIPVVGGLFSGAQKVVGGAIGKIGGFIGGLFGKKKKEPEPQTIDPYQALSQMSMMGGFGMGGLPGMGMMSLPATITAGAMKTDTSKIENLLSELIMAVRSKTVIHMDGMKVGEAIMSANRGL